MDMVDMYMEIDLVDMDIVDGDFKNNLVV